MMRNKTKGFTLVELLIATAVFAVVISVASSISVSSIRVQKRALASQEIVDQTSYLMEYISRAIRMGSDYRLIPGGIGFKNYQGVDQEFYLENGQLKERKDKVVSLLTSANLSASVFNVSIGGSQPLVSFSLEIAGKDQSKIKIQTAVSQRNLKI